MRRIWYRARVAALVPFLLGWIGLAARAAGPGPMMFEVEGARIVARDTSGAALEWEDLIGNRS